MKCGRVLELIEDYHYGELGDAVEYRVRSHLRQCGECSEALESLRAESLLFRAYAKSVEVVRMKPAVWEAVLRRIREVPRSRSGWHDLIFPDSELTGRSLVRLGLAFGAVLVLVMTIAVVFRSLDKSFTGNRTEVEVPSRAPQAAPLSGGGGGESARGRDSFQVAVWSIRRAEEEYIEAIEVLTAAVSERKQNLDPQRVASFERDLRAVDRSIGASSRAYRARPRDFDLGQNMLTAYARKLEMLQTLGS